MTWTGRVLCDVARPHEFPSSGHASAAGPVAHVRRNTVPRGRSRMEGWLMGDTRKEWTTSTAPNRHINGISDNSEPLL
jgi:hypothetical protein